MVAGRAVHSDPAEVSRGEPARARERRQRRVVQIRLGRAVCGLDPHLPPVSVRLFVPLRRDRDRRRERRALVHLRRHDAEHRLGGREVVVLHLLPGRARARRNLVGAVGRERRRDRRVRLPLRVPVRPDRQPLRRPVGRDRDRLRARLPVRQHRARLAQPELDRQGLRRNDATADRERDRLTLRYGAGVHADADLWLNLRGGVRGCGDTVLSRGGGLDLLVVGSREGTGTGRRPVVADHDVLALVYPGRDLEKQCGIECALPDAGDLHLDTVDRDREGARERVLDRVRVIRRGRIEGLVESDVDGAAAADGVRQEERRRRLRPQLQRHGVLAGPVQGTGPAIS